MVSNLMCEERLCLCRSLSTVVLQGSKVHPDFRMDHDRMDFDEYHPANQMPTTMPVHMAHRGTDTETGCLLAVDAVVVCNETLVVSPEVVLAPVVEPQYFLDPVVLLYVEDINQEFVYL